MIIVGAGMAGLIAGNYFKGSTIIEQQTELPNNHQALLRFKTDEVSKITGIPFTKVMARKAIAHQANFLDIPNIYAANQYSMKVTGEVHDRSIWDVEDGPRYLAPNNFAGQLALGLNILYGQSLDPIDGQKAPFISTIPMPILMGLVGWPTKPEFEYRSIWTLKVVVREPITEVEQTIYFTSPDIPFYRATLSGRMFTVEFTEFNHSNTNDLVAQALDFFGIADDATWGQPVVHQQKFGKILPIDESMRQDFIYTMSRERNIYSLGRFATWRPGLLLDDIPKDLKIIEGLVSHEGARRNYSQNLAIAAKAN